MAKPLSERVKDSQARVIEGGGRKISAVIRPEIADAIDKLIAAGYAATTTGCISLAIQEAVKRLKQKGKL